MKKFILALIVLFAGNAFSFKNDNDIFGSRGFIENKGQFNTALNRPNAKILFAYEHVRERIYFTENGPVFKFTKEFPLDHEEHEALERGKDVKSKPSIHYYVDVKWIGANSNITVESSLKQDHYFTYGTAELNSYVYKKITYKNVYDNIDIEYFIPKEHETGIKYNVVVHPGGDPSKVKISYNGDVQKIKLKENQIIIKSKLDELMEHEPVSFSNGKKIATDFVLENDIISFNVKGDYDKNSDLIIDPWVTNTTSLPSTNYGFDVDYDYAGNLYVFGATGPFMIAKYGPAGNLIWTFGGTVAVPAWTSLGSHPSNYYMGNLVVNKFTGKTYTGQGFNNSQGARIVRIDQNGVYDNFITPSVTSWNEAWEMGFHCGSGNVYGIGGSIVSNQSAGVINQITAALNPISLTTSGAIAQDVVNATIDEQGNTFIIYASYSAGFNNLICRVNAAFTGTVWGANSTYNVMAESANKNAYLGMGNLTGSNSNAFNCLAVNGNYLFYYDGLNLAAYSKVTGAKIAFTTIPGYVLKRQGGIDVDDCNNLYIGGNNGTILSYHFNGTSFVQLPTINMNVTTTNKFVYDIKYEKGQNLLYVTGSGFVGTFSAINSLSCTINQYSVVPVCVGNNNGSAVTTVTTNMSNPIFSYTYTNATGTVATTANSALPSNTVTNLTNGNYTVYVQINAPCGPINTMTFNINCLCSATAIANTSCTPTGSSFSLGVTATSGFAGTPSYTWTGPGGYSSTLQNPTFLNGTYGTYTLTAADPGCTSTTTVNATPVSQFTPGITNTAVACYNGTTGLATTTVTGGSAPFTYTWSTNPPQNGVTATNLAAGTYTCLVQDALNCVYSATTTVTQPPAVTVAVNSTTFQACTGSTIGLSASGSGGTGTSYTYTWSTTAVSPTINVAETTGGIYTYSVTGADVSGCTANTTHTVQFVQSPSLTVSNAEICIGSSTVLTASGASTLTWLPAGTTGSTVNLGPQSTTTYTLMGATGFCTSQVPFTVTVNPLPTVIITKNDIKCFNGIDGTATISVNGGTAPFQYQWSSSPSHTNVSTNNLAAGTYTGSIVDVNGCANSNTVTINMPPLFYVGINSSSLTVCAGETITLTAAVSGGTGPAYTYTWSNAMTGFNSTVSNNPGTYVYSLSATDANGCISSNSVSLTFKPLPVISVNSPTVCQGGKVTLTASGGDTYFWPTQYNTNPGITFYATQDSIIPVMGYAIGCYGTATSTVKVIPAPEATISSDIKGHCVPFCVNLTSASQSSIVSYGWYMNGALLSNTSTVNSLCFSQPGDYKITINLTNSYGCKATTPPYVINAWPLPFADFHFEGALTDVYNEVNFVDHSTNIIKGWFWDFGDGSTSTVQNPVHAFGEIKTYQTFLVVTNNYGCIDTTSKTINIRETPSIFVPNSFTPNGDGLNDSFGAKAIALDSYRIQIFDRWGEKMFESDDLEKQWDGTFKGKACKNDVYVWKITYGINKAKVETITGHVNLMK